MYLESCPREQIKFRCAFSIIVLACLALAWFMRIATVSAHSRPSSPSLTTATAQGVRGQVKVFEVFQLTLEAQAAGSNPYVDGPTVMATFTGMSDAARGKHYTVDGFWDGGKVWRIRFAPTAAGDWSYSTSSSDPRLNGVTGSLTAVPHTAAELADNPLRHGFLERDGPPSTPGQAWKLSDGTPFLPVGDTQWSFSEELLESEWKEWVNVLHDRGYNTFLGTIWLAQYTRANIAPFLHCNSKSCNPKTDEHLNPAYFQRLDKMVSYANEHGIMMGLMIGSFPGNSSWLVKFGTKDRHDRWFEYCIARYAAYNVRWVLFGEVDEARLSPKGDKRPPWGGDWKKLVDDYAKLVKAGDPYGHPLGSHHTSVDTSSADKSNIDYIEVQIGRCKCPDDETQYRKAASYRDSYHKPVWFEEYWYEPFDDNSPELGIRNTHRNFIAALAFPTMGSLMRAHSDDPDFPPTKARQHGQSLYNYLTDPKNGDPGMRRMKHFADFYRGLDMRDFPTADKPPATDTIHLSHGQAGKFGDSYAIFLQGGRQATVSLPGSGVFTVTKLDINSGLMGALHNIYAGRSQTINTNTTNDVALLLRPTGPGTRAAAAALIDRANETTPQQPDGQARAANEVTQTARNGQPGRTIARDFNREAEAERFGLPGDVPVPADYDGDGQADRAVWRPTEGVWYIIKSSAPESIVTQQLGRFGDVPVPADYDGDGIVDLAVWRPSEGRWYFLPSSGRQPQQNQALPATSENCACFVLALGQEGDVAVPADYDGDGVADPAVWRPTTGEWLILPSTLYSRPSGGPAAPTLSSPTLVRRLGLPGDIPVPADYDGDGLIDLAIFRSQESAWYIAPSTGTFPLQTAVQGVTSDGYPLFVRYWGLPGDLPLAADYDGDRYADLLLWRPAEARWYVLPSAGESSVPDLPRQWTADGHVFFALPLGLPSDVPVAARYRGQPTIDLAGWRPSDGQWYLLAPDAAACPLYTTVAGQTAADHGICVMRLGTSSSPDGGTAEPEAAVADDSLRTAAAVSCSFSFNPPLRYITSQGGSANTYLRTGNGCRWTISNIPNWVGLSVTSGTGFRRLVYQVLPNNSSSGRRADLKTSNAVHTVFQDGNPCNYRVDPDTLTFTSGGGSLFFQIYSNCHWKLRTSNNAFGFTFSKSEGFGDAGIIVTAPPNHGRYRRLLIPIGDKDILIEQAAAGF